MCDSKVRMPRSQSITLGIPALRSSAASNNSSSVALAAFQQTGLPSAPTDSKSR